LVEHHRAGAHAAPTPGFRGSNDFWADFWATVASGFLLLKGNKESER
jgi:hypothetical protein